MSVRARDATIKHLVESHILYGKLRRRDLWRFNRLSKKIERYQTNRDMLAHGLWCKFGKSWFVLQVRQIRVVPELRPKLQNLSRATLPQRQKITRAKLRSICRQIVALAKRWRSMGSALRGRSPHSLNCGVHRPNTLGGGMTIVQSQDAKLRRTAIMPRA